LEYFQTGDTTNTIRTNSGRQENLTAKAGQRRKEDQFLCSRYIRKISAAYRRKNRPRQSGHKSGAVMYKRNGKAPSPINRMLLNLGLTRERIAPASSINQPISKKDFIGRLPSLQLKSLI
jgi:hypothetical protein